MIYSVLLAAAFVLAENYRRLLSDESHGMLVSISLIIHEGNSQ